MNSSSKPDGDIIAYNFGITEIPEGFAIYLIGSKEFDSDDDDWACNEDFVPKNKYLNFSKDELENSDWNNFLELAKSDISSFINSDFFENSFLSLSEAITVGFDDGELIRLV